MTTDQVKKSDFFKNFIIEYLEHSRYIDADKVKLMYALCTTELQKNQVTLEQIEKLKIRIKELGHEELSYAYIYSSTPEGRDFIESYESRTNFWITRFAEDYCDNINNLTLISDEYLKFEKFWNKRLKKPEDIEFRFWEIFKEWKPKNNNISYIIEKEAELIDQIKDDIKNYKKNKYWDIYCFYYEEFIDVSKAIALLFQYCELLDSLEKLEEFKSYTNIKDTTDHHSPKIFEELFHIPEQAEKYLNILREINPPVIDAANNYIGKNKGVFPIWIRALKTHKPEPIIKHFKDSVYKDILNIKVKGLNLSKDASEFRKTYKRLDNSNIESDIKRMLSQSSQSGTMGK